jgi:hypothetical protein
VDRWVAKVEDALIAGGADENAKDFDQIVQKRMEDDIASKTGGKAPEDFARVLRTVFSLKQQGKLQEAGSLLSWLSGSLNVASSEKSIDAADRYKGLLWVFTGTPEFFDIRRGVAGLQPLHDRIQFLAHGELASPRQAQLELKPRGAAMGVKRLRRSLGS